MIGISTQTSNANGAVIINEDTSTKIYESTARVTRTGTLDGRAVIAHLGHTDGDMTLKISGQVQKADETKLKNIYEDETLVTIATKYGCYSGAIRTMNKLNGQIYLSVLIKEKLSS